MASEIKVDTIVNAGGDNDTGIDLATNDQILLKVANSTKLTMNSTGQTTIVGEGGTTTTSVQQGLTKAWSNLDGSGTAANRDSFNMSGVTDNAVGKYRLTFSNNMSNNDFSVSGSCRNNIDDLIMCVGNDDAIATSHVEVTSNTTTNFGDNNLISSSMHGDLA